MQTTRFFPLIIVVMTTILVLTPTLLDAQDAWFDRAPTGMEVGPTGAQFGNSDRSDTRYAARFDGREIVRRCLAAHSEYVVLWARDGDYAYYQSKLLPIAPGLGARDPLREAVDEAHRHRLPLPAYCVVQQGGHYLNAHPEFEMRGVDGKPLGRFCYNSGYLEAMKQIVAEQLAYGIDGFHIDMVDQGFGAPYGCWCDSCRHKFATEFGHPMPTGARWEPGWAEMLEFRYRTSAEFERNLRAYIRSLNPKATVDFNYHGNPPFSWEVGQRPVQHAGNGGFNTGETGQWGFSALGPTPFRECNSCQRRIEHRHPAELEFPGEWPWHYLCADNSKASGGTLEAMPFYASEGRQRACGLAGERGIGRRACDAGEFGW